MCDWVGVQTYARQWYSTTGPSHLVPNRIMQNRSDVLVTMEIKPCKIDFSTENKISLHFAWFFFVSKDICYTLFTAISPTCCH